MQNPSPSPDFVIAQRQQLEKISALQQEMQAEQQHRQSFLHRPRQLQFFRLSTPFQVQAQANPPQASLRDDHKQGTVSDRACHVVNVSYLHHADYTVTWWFLNADPSCDLAYFFLVELCYSVCDLLKGVISAPPRGTTQTLQCAWLVCICPLSPFLNCMWLRPKSVLGVL